MVRNNLHPIRVLHVVGSMNRGGVETWLMHILRHIDREKFHMDFLIHTTKNSAYDEEIRAFGSQIIPCLHTSQPWLYAYNFKRVLRIHGPYDIIHSHVHHYSGYVLRLAQTFNIPGRIAHSHNDTVTHEAHAGFLRRRYLSLMKHWINCCATIGLAASNLAAKDLFGQKWKADPRWQVLLYGIPLGLFQDAIDPIAVRQELNIPADAFVIGHVGRFAEQKNHTFLIDIAAEVARRKPETYLLLVGEGSLRPAIEQRAAQVGIVDRTIFTGSRPDVPRLMRGAMDVFLFPSHYEGLGLVLIEAQAAGLPCAFTSVVPKEAEVVTPLLKRLSLSQPATVWAEAILEMHKAAAAVRQSEALAIVANSPFNIHYSVKRLESIYRVRSFTETVIKPRIPSPSPHQFD